MNQGTLFDGDDQPAEAIIGAEVVYVAGFVPVDVADRLFSELEATTPWRQDVIRMHGREVPIPRLQSWHGDPGRTYTYSGIEMAAMPWTATLAEVRQRIEEAADTEFNSVLCNLYRHGRDSVAWHSDDEPELGANPVIASASFGATRRFHLRHRTQSDQRHTIDLDHGSLLVMRGTSQHVWEHQVPKTSKPVGARINLTFRTIR